MKRRKEEKVGEREGGREERKEGRKEGENDKQRQSSIAQVNPLQQSKAHNANRTRNGSTQSR